ncbi:MAG TPA: threonine/serine dehydratase [Acidimicrobiia bacterium]
MRLQITAAADRIAGHVLRTPVMDIDLDGSRVGLKLELVQYTGSFKLRGALNRILSGEVPEAGVIAASGGNHGLAVAYGAGRLGHRVEIFVADVTPAVKVERLRAYGAEVTVAGGFYADALAASEVRARQTGALVVHAYDQVEVVAGQGTVGKEITEQVGDVDTILVAVGGGGLIGGIAGWAAGALRVVGVEPIGCPTLSSALDAGRPVEVEVGGVAADSLGARVVGQIGLDLSTRFVDRVVLVTDDEIRAAQRFLWHHHHLVSEPGGATALAALLAGRYRPTRLERVVALVCGSNTDPGGLPGL